MREVIIGFDSAWTDSLKNPGAITACVINEGRAATFFPPFLITFDKAVQWIDELSATADYSLIAIDQPTIVPNETSCRPVDRVAASLVSRLGGGVQPAYRGGLRASIFGDNAPLWRFLAGIDAIQNPIEGRKAASGRFLMEVFPALALPAIVPLLWNRGRAAKYNPANRKTFKIADWKIVTSGVASFTQGLAATDLTEWLLAEAARSAPRKADQDRLDAAICLAIGLAWRHGPQGGTMQIGDELTGYMTTVISAQTRAVLVEAAGMRNVHVDRAWYRHSPAVTASYDLMS